MVRYARAHLLPTVRNLDGIAVGERDFEAVEKLWHCVLAPLATALQ